MSMDHVLWASTTCHTVRFTRGLGSFKQGGPEALIDLRGKGKTMHDQLTDDEKRDLEVKRLKARIEHLSTKNAVLKKLQESKGWMPLTIHLRTNPSVSDYG